MAALTKTRDTQWFGQPMYTCRYDLAASTTIYGGSLVAINASGNAVPFSTSTTLVAVGIAKQDYVNSTGSVVTNGCEVLVGIAYFDSGTAGDAITKANIGTTVWGSDDHTVNATNGGATRSKAGTVIQVDATYGVAVFVGAEQTGAI